MKLNKYRSDEYVHYWNSDEVVEIPEYHFDKQSVRGVWVSTVANIDVPKGLPENEYKEYLTKMIENIASYNINTIIFQVRPNNDAFYPSKLNPWSRYITGEEGKDPGFDVLKYVIEEAKKHDIKVHAWMNPYRVSQASLDQLNMTKEEYLATLAPNNFARLHPEHTILDGANKIILSPSRPEVIDFVTKTIMEVVDNYDVEGVHIDDYFYPYAKIPEEREREDYLKYRLDETQCLDDFRRMNVNKMIKNIHDALKNSFSKSNKKVLFGISPFAIYRTNSAILEGGWEKGSYNAAGALQCYSELYSDVYLWMKENWIDYVVPQVYFPFERKDVTYHDLTKWWSDICNETHTILYIGMGLYQMGSNEVWQNPNEIENQLRFNCNFNNVAGTIFFTYHDLVKGQNEIKDEALDTIKKLWK
ncbi:MAG: family 10 glycosylhydrolase [Bacilli bacterium]|nr:family 10 glycosylhydrolase [Bacilli bacterium]